jgi:hypothetical protein
VQDIFPAQTKSLLSSAPSQPPIFLSMQAANSGNRDECTPGLLASLFHLSDRLLHPGLQVLGDGLVSVGTGIVAIDVFGEPFSIFRLKLTKRISPFPAGSGMSVSNFLRTAQVVNVDKRRFMEIGVDPFKVLSDAELAVLHLNIQKRHIIGHNLPAKAGIQGGRGTGPRLAPG